MMVGKWVGAWGILTWETEIEAKGREQKEQKWDRTAAGSTALAWRRNTVVVQIG